MKCPKCGEDVTSKFCPKCGTQVDYYEEPRPTVPPSSFSEEPQKKKHTGIGIVSFVLSFLGPLALVGLVLAIVDLVKDKTKQFKHGLSIAAIVISLFSLCIFSFMPKNSEEVDSKSTEKIVEESSEETPIEDTETEVAQSDAEVAEEEVSEPEIIEPQITKEEFVASCTDLNESYKVIARNPDDYIGQNFFFTCYVSDSRETSGFLTGNQKYYITYKFDVEKADEAVRNGWADSVSDGIIYALDYEVSAWLVEGRENTDPDYVKILDEDVITVYGTFEGMMSTQNSLTGESGEEMSLTIKYVDLLIED